MYLFVWLLAVWCLWAVAASAQVAARDIREPLPEGRRRGMSIVPVIPLYPAILWLAARGIDKLVDPWGTALMATLHLMFAAALSWSLYRDYGTLRNKASDRPLSTRLIRLIGLLTISWCVMTVTHECGHLIGGWLGGGTLQHAELRPWHLPHSLFDPDPRPLLTLWCGPILGAIFPLAVAVLLRRPWMCFVGDFCLLANGAYLATAWIAGDQYLDTPRLLQAGASPWWIAAFCTVTIVPGYVRFRADCRVLFHVDTTANGRKRD